MLEQAQRDRDQVNLFLGNSPAFEDLMFMQECWDLINSRTPNTSLKIYENGTIRQSCGKRGSGGEADVYKIGLVDLNTDIENLQNLRRIGVISDADYNDICKKLLHTNCETHERKIPQHSSEDKAVTLFLSLFGPVGVSALVYLGFLSAPAFAAPLPAVEIPQEPTPLVQLYSPTAQLTPIPQILSSETIVDDCSVSSNFPPGVIQWCDLIDEYASKTGLHPDLISSVMLHESGGNPDAYSKSGAVGLLQVMPKDGIAADFMCINGPCFADRPTTEELLDPETNVAFGSDMLAGLIKRNGDIRGALMSYGPQDVGYYYADLVLEICRSHSPEPNIACE